MKFNLLSLPLFSFLMFLCTLCHAQQFLRAGTLNAGASTIYKVEKISKDSIAVFNASNNYYDSLAKSPKYPMSIFKRTAKLIPSFTSAFPEYKIQDQLLAERSITINFYVDREGFIQDIAFLLRKDTRVTSFDIERFQIALGTERFEGLRSGKNKPGEILVIQRVINYRRVLDRTADILID